jgi:hypothetical protein
MATVKLELSGSEAVGVEKPCLEQNVGQLTFDGLGPYDLPDATYADARKDGDGYIFSFRLWKSENEWTLVRIRVSDEEADKVRRQIGDERMRTDGDVII